MHQRAKSNAKRLCEGLSPFFDGNGLDSWTTHQGGKNPTLCLDLQPGPFVPHERIRKKKEERKIRRKIRKKDRMICIILRILDPCMGHALLVEVVAIVNSRPLTPVSTEPEDPFLLTPATLLTQKVAPPVPAPPDDFYCKDLYKWQRRQGQSLTDTLWGMWP